MRKYSMLVGETHFGSQEQKMFLDILSPMTGCGISDIQCTSPSRANVSVTYMGFNKVKNG